ncbi:alkane 1-monooxygenase [Hasllibacter sp. MH4015]|uniref:alkane 1-monooxygenase n=1 Tax=Hasllibacter sp. MH4015 TaxID=2854029 RepID=UPI001CD23007|nr:alkane 1-monooxygenase [Hasllibacter sp. MH4015]
MPIPVIARYAIVTIVPMFLLILAGTAWGGFAYIALAWLTVIAAVADRLLDRPTTPPVEEETLPWSDVLSIALAVGHVLVLVAALKGLTSGALSFWQAVAYLFATASFFGQVSHPNAHELIHRRPVAMRWLGAAVYTSVGFGHHVSAHRLVHHRNVGTEEDPNTPLPGESFWDYLPRAWRGSFEAGLAAEMEKLERKDRPYTHITNPYWVWVGGAVVSLILSIIVAGIGGALVLIALGALTGLQILMSDYVQHYGLQRLILPNGRLEPVAPHHSWNAPRGFSSYLMMNAPAHSEHHMHPDRPYERLDSQATVPVLPYSMPVMAMIAMIPAAWHRMMDRRALKVMEAAEEMRRNSPPAPDVTPRRPGAVRAAARVQPQQAPEDVPAVLAAAAAAAAEGADVVPMPSRTETAPQKAEPDQAPEEPATEAEPTLQEPQASAPEPERDADVATMSEPLDEDEETAQMRAAIRAATR